MIIAYEVSYHSMADPQSVTRVNTSGLATSLTVSGLQPGTELTFTMRAYTRVRAGETSAVTAVTHISAREMHFLWVCISCSPDDLCHTAPVENVVATAVNATVVRVTWRTLDLELSYYTVLYSGAGGGGTGRSVTLSANETSVVVGGLVPGEEYMLQVVAVAEINGSIMEGERSAVAMATTPGGKYSV